MSDPLPQLYTQEQLEAAIALHVQQTQHQTASYVGPTFDTSYPPTLVMSQFGEFVMTPVVADPNPAFGAQIVDYRDVITSSETPAAIQEVLDNPPTLSDDLTDNVPMTDEERGISRTSRKKK